MDYENSNATLVEEDDLEKSLREILPSEGHRKKMQSDGLLAASPRNDDNAAFGQHRLWCQFAFAFDYIWADFWELQNS